MGEGEGGPDQEDIRGHERNGSGADHAHDLEPAPRSMKVGAAERRRRVAQLVQEHEHSGGGQDRQGAGRRGALPALSEAAGAQGRDAGPGQENSREQRHAGRAQGRGVVAQGRAGAYHAAQLERIQREKHQPRQDADGQYQIEHAEPGEQVAMVEPDSGGEHHHLGHEENAGPRGQEPEDAEPPLNGIERHRSGEDGDQHVGELIDGDQEPGQIQEGQELPPMRIAQCHSEAPCGGRTMWRVPMHINLYFVGPGGHPQPGKIHARRPPFMPIRTTPLVRHALWICLALAACGSDPTGGGGPTGVSVTSGDNQLGTVGSALAVHVVFKVSNANGGVSGVSISAAVPQGQGGSATPQNGTSDANGLFTVTWTLGPRPGDQSLTATASGGFSATAHATANVGPPVALIAVSPAFQYAVVGHAVSTLPVVKVTDASGNGIPGVAVTFQLLPPPGGVATGTDQITDASGQATIGSWSIGQDAVSYFVRGTITNGSAAPFEAHGIPATVSATAGDGQTANSGTAVPVVPAVKAARDDGSALPNVAVTFSVLDGGGRVDGGSTVTGADGTAEPTRWVLRAAPGLHHLTAQVAGRDPVSFSATGVAATPAAMIAESPTSQTGFFGNYLASRPAVQVNDAQGKPVAGAAVTFSITQGDGTVSGAAQTTAFEGRAGLLAWRLGPSAASQAVQASVGGTTPVSFSATATTPPAGTFHITVRYDSTCTGCREGHGGRAPYGGLH